MKKIAFIIALLSQFQSVGQLICKATQDPTGGYNAIVNAGLDYESPDCVHQHFGNHITQVYDSVLMRPVFVFHSHIEDDNDRCQVFDRVRMEIKGGPNTNPESQHGINSISYYRWKFMVPADFQGSSSFCHIFQNKIVGGNDSSFPLITLTPRANVLELIHNGGDSGNDLGRIASVDLALIKGRWIEAFVHQRHAENGLIEVTLKDVVSQKTILHYKNENIDLWRAGGEYARPKWGIYRLKSSNLKNEIIRFSDFCISEKDSMLCPSDVLEIIDTIPPTSPQNLSLINKSRTTAELIWTASSDNIEVLGYEVLRDGALIASSSELTLVDTSLIAGTMYSYTVRALDLAGNFSKPSDTLEVVTDEASALPDRPILTNPQNNASNISTTPSLEWQIADNATSYRVYISTDSIPVLLGSTEANSFSLELTENMTYFWQIGSINENGEEKSELRKFTTINPNDTLSWMTYRANDKMHLETAFFELNASHDSPLLDTLISDSNGSGNSFYVYADRSESNFRWRNHGTAQDKAITIVARIKAYSADFPNICFFEIRNGSWREKVRINQTSIKLERSNPVIEVNLPFDLLQEFHIIRITMEGKFTKIYLDENPEPIAVGESGEANTGNYFEWGKSSTMPYASMIDWLTIDRQGTFAPGEGKPLPADLFLSSDASLSSLEVDGILVPNFDPNQLEYTLPISSENEPIISFTTTSPLAKVVTFTPDSPPKNYAEVRVIAQDAWTKKTYKINYEKTTASPLIDWKDEVLVYPNPVSKTLNIACGDQVTGVYYLYDVLGSLKMSNKFKGNFEMNVAQLPEGMYLLQLMKDNQSFLIKKISIHHP